MTKIYSQNGTTYKLEAKNNKVLKYFKNNAGKFIFLKSYSIN